jgi:hypothetical protein
MALKTPLLTTYHDQDTIRYQAIFGDVPDGDRHGDCLGL